MIAWAKANAVWLQSVLQAGLALGVACGLHLTDQQLGAVLAFSAIVLGVSAHVAKQTA